MQVGGTNAGGGAERSHRGPEEASGLVQVKMSENEGEGVDARTSLPV